MDADGAEEPEWEEPECTWVHADSEHRSRPPDGCAVFLIVALNRNAHPARPLRAGVRRERSIVIHAHHVPIFRIDVQVYLLPTALFGIGLPKAIFEL
ncbi:hypothetical protein Xcc3_00260 [Xanthomonas campestris pv. campestris]|nr:hypothetical protein Xcc3_00260 [Xanthomonas campestris pv. campestris]